ncbi:hypothetical protein KCG44_04385 [Pacificimonas sp. WHA3]|uniref:Uncharacterized protein n=1 Tax=Pacificimonas pallii TaxID=2827236 RepID=A0ABS6SC88_9SPHN|nr:hypothetical protein [Pacificimonas pallii]MBV7256019.1 hypothetical protein [Pacificimonas pallii]
MQEVFVAMAILGCGHTAGTCETVSIVDANFGSVDACHAAAPGVLRKLTDIDFPVVTIECDGREKLAKRAKAQNKALG